MEGPAWFQAGIYISLWVVIVLLGRRVCPVPPRTYLLTCVCFDIVCLVLQATGGGLSGAAFEEGKSTEPGTHTMLAGIIAQLYALSSLERKSYTANLVPVLAQ
jgi:hypothetical protein